ncbi:MAG: hypothetical protein M3Y81_16405 [Chloroflexota bacterium]|nr:hypothetical protein [Chloroflexota bacterium]
MKKICSGCGQERDAELDFSWKHKDRGIRNTRCKLCQSQASKLHYKNNKQSYFDHARAREPLITEDNQRKLAEYLSCHPCIDCGKTDIRVLEFDHVLGHKSANIARLLNNAISWKAIEDEIAKCEVRCVNCHRIKTGERAGWWRFERNRDTTSSPEHQPELSGGFEEAQEPSYIKCSICTDMHLMKKFCSSCGEERDAEKDFSWRDRDHGIRQPRCKYCQSEMSKLHYQNNRRIYNERTRIGKARAVAENRLHISSYLSTHPCVDCSQTDIRLLEFDHIDGQKSRGIANFLTWGFKWSTIEAEIAKCEVRCANCHRLKTMERGKWWRCGRS